MVHNLLQVCLLTITMGVGAKASTPIKLNRHEERQTQQANYDPEQLNFSTNTSISDFTYRDYYYAYPGTPQYSLFNAGSGQREATTTQMSFKDIVYNNEGALHYDPSNPNDVWMFRKETFQPEANYISRAEILSITPTTTIYNSTLTKEVATNLVTNENITANMEIRFKAYTSTTGAFDTYRTYDSTIKAKDVATYIQNNVQATQYDYYEDTFEFIVDINTPGATFQKTWFTFPIPLLKDHNTTIVMTYQVVCTNYDVDPTSLMFDNTAMANNGIYSQSVYSSETQVEGNWSTAEVTQEIVDIPGLLWEILAMPFSFISTAFNLTLFPGTPYSLNFTNLFMVIILVLIILFFVKKFKP